MGRRWEGDGKPFGWINFINNLFNVFGNRVFKVVMTFFSYNNVVNIGKVSSTGIYEDKSDDELMRLAAIGYKDAFAQIVKRYQGSIRGFCTKWHGQKGDDLAQDVFIRLWKSRESYKPQNEFRAYLFVIAANICKNASRRQMNKPVMEVCEPEKIGANASSDQLDKILNEEKMEKVHREITKLSPKLKEAILLRFQEDLNYQQIAQITGSNQVTMRSRVLLAIKKLKAGL